jgi:DNA-binding NarL/FixJ family response regulator
MKVLIVEDLVLLAEAIQVALCGQGIEVVAIASTGEEGLGLLLEMHPDVVLLDIGLPGRAGIMIGQEMLQHCPGLKVLALSTSTDARLARKAIRAGFSGYLTRDTDVACLARAMEAATSGEVTISDGVARQPADASSEDEMPLMLSRLTDRERDVLTLLAEGADSEVIADRFEITRHTVRTHMQSIFLKLNAHSRLEATAIAVRHGIVAVGSGRQPR